GDTPGTNPPRSGNYAIGSTTQFAQDTIGFTGNYVQATLGNNSGGNYLLFTDVTGDSFTLTATPVNFRSPVNALQIVATPEPATLAFAGVSMLSLVGYAWRRRKATAGA